MIAQKYALPWDDEELTFNLPEAWEVLGTLQPNEVPPVEDVERVRGVQLGVADWHGAPSSASIT